MSRILIDQEGLRGTANELRSIDSELGALRGRMRGAALGAMPPDIIARIGATTARADVVLYAHGERLRVEAGRLEWRAAAAEVAGGSDPSWRGSFDFLDRSGLLGLASLSLAPSRGGLRWTNDGLATWSGRIERTSSLYLGSSSLRQRQLAAGRHGLLTHAPGFGRQGLTFAKRARQLSGKVGKVTGWIGDAFTAADVFEERAGRGNGAVHAGVDTAAIMASRVAGRAAGAKVGMVAGAALGSVFGPAGTLVGGALGTLAGGWIGGELGERIGEWGVDHAEEAIGSTLQSAGDLAQDAGRVATDVADRAGDAVKDVGNAVRDKLKLW